MKKTLKKVLLTTLCFFALTSTIVLVTASEADSIQCTTVNKFRVTGYDAVGRCNLFSYFDTYSDASNFIALSDPTYNFNHSGYGAYCTPLVTKQCGGTTE